MKRIDLLNAVDELKDSGNISHSIDMLKDLVGNFCDNYETEFNHIRDNLDALAPHIEKVQEAHSIAERCSKELY